MKKQLRGYTKPDASLEPKEKKVNAFDVSPRLELAQNSIIPLNDAYVKKDGYLSPALFVIVSGGEKREKDYFKIISKIESFPRIKICFVANDRDTGEGGLSPLKMFVEAKKIKDEYAEGKPDDIIDQIYLLSDVDDFMGELLKIKPHCVVEDLNLIVSNPCFEVWLYYCCFSDKPDDFHMGEPLKVSLELKRYLNEKKPGGINPVTSIFCIQHAIENAEQNYSEDKNGIPVFFSTNMFLLAKEIYPLVESELQKMKIKVSIR